MPFIGTYESDPRHAQLHTGAVSLALRDILVSPISCSGWRSIPPA